MRRGELVMAGQRAVVAGTALLVLASGCGGGHRSRHVSTSPAITSEVTTTATPTTVATAGGDQHQAAQPAPATTGPSCANSFDPRCGPQRWQPDPGPNSGVKATLLRWSPPNPGVNDSLSYTVRIEDSDASLTADNVVFDDDDGEHNHYLHEVLLYRNASSCPRRTTPYGTWTTPARRLGGVEITHTFHRGGGFPIVEYIEAASDLCSFIGYPPDALSRSWRQGPKDLDPGPAYFNPYASFGSWVVCVESAGRVKLVDFKDASSCRQDFTGSPSTTSTTSTSTSTTTAPPSTSTTTTTP